MDLLTFSTDLEAQADQLVGFITIVVEQFTQTALTSYDCAESKPQGHIITINLNSTFIQY